MEFKNNPPKFSENCIFDCGGFTAYLKESCLKALIDEPLKLGKTTLGLKIGDAVGIANETDKEKVLHWGIVAMKTKGRRPLLLSKYRIGGNIYLSTIEQMMEFYKCSIAYKVTKVPKNVVN